MKKTYQIRGFTLLIAIITTSMLLLVSFVIANIALDQIIITLSDKASENAFYASDSAAECAIYWDVKNPTDPSRSAFDVISPTDPIRCNNTAIATTRLANADNTLVTTNFRVQFTDGCADVTVTKITDSANTVTQTEIDSQGYNTCDTSSLRRFARGITIIY